MVFIFYFIYRSMYNGGDSMSKVAKVSVQKQIEEVFDVESLQDKIFNYVEENSSSEVEKGQRFCEWILKYMFERMEDEIIESTEIAGKSDNSVDAWYEENNTLYIIQAKYNTSHKWSGVTNFIVDMNRLLDNPYAIAGNNNKLYDLSERIEEFKIANKAIEFYYITDNKFTFEETEKISFEKNKFDNRTDKVSLYVYDIESIKDYFEMALNRLPKRYRNKETQLILKNKFVSDTTCVAEVSLKDFAVFTNKNKDYLFYSNIRNYLRTTDVNTGIVNTFKSKPTDFWYYNNGITIVCDDFTLKDFLIEITTPQIVNGCQTANTILNEYKRLDDDQKKNLQGTILVKIIKDINGKRKDDITRFTNKQNSVTGKDFFALDRFQRKLKNEFAELGYYYEIQNKSSLGLSKQSLSKFKGDKNYKYLFDAKFNNVIAVKEVVQAYAAGMHFMPGTAASRAGELMPYGKNWDKLFNDDTPEDPYHFLFPYAIMKYAKTKLEYNSSSSVDYKKICLMFFVASYFKTLTYLLKEIGFHNKMDNFNPLDIDIEALIKIFQNEKVNISILRLTDSIIKFYMRDGKIKELINELYGAENVSNFMKSHVQSNQTAIERLNDIIKDCIDMDFSNEDKDALKALICK